MAEYDGQLLTIVWSSVSNCGYNDAYHYVDNLKFACHGGVRDVYASVCAGEPYMGNGFNITQQETVGQAGVLEFDRLRTAQNSAECDTTIRLHLTVNPSYNTIIYDSFCEGTVYSKGLFLNKTEGGLYMETFVAATGCDSTVTLSLTELPTVFEFDTALCEGGSIMLGDRVIVNSGTYTDSLISTATGCDSVVIFNVRVAPKFYDFSHRMCEGESYVWRDETLYTSGVYVDSLVASNGCDSIVTLNLMVMPTQTVVDTTICEGQSVFFDGDFINQSGTYTFTVIGASGCDSTATLNLTVAPADTVVVNDFTCEGESYWGNGFSDVMISQDSVLFGRTQGDDDCVSITELHLRLSPTQYTYDTVAIGAGETYIFGGNTLSTSGDYDHVYSNVEGCDSVVYLNLTVATGLGTIEVQNLTLAPNPINSLGYSVIHRDWTFAEQNGMRMEIIDATGKVLYSTDVTDFPIVVDGISVNGMYYVKITTGTGEVHIGKLIVK